MMKSDLADALRKLSEGDTEGLEKDLAAMESAEGTKFKPILTDIIYTFDDTHDCF